MKQITVNVIFLLICIFTFFHLIRDLLQIFDVSSVITTTFHRPHMWCRDLCDYATIPLEGFQLIGSMCVMKYKKIDLIGWSVIVTMPLWLVMQWLP